MRVNLAYNMARRLEQLAGTLLVLVGFGFFALFAYVKLTGLLSGDLKVSAFMLAAGLTLLWVGYRFLRSDGDESSTKRSENSLSNLTRLHFTAETVTAVGCIAMLWRGICVMIRVSWPSEPVLYILLIAPVLIGQIILKALKPGALRNGVFPPAMIERWSNGTRRLVSLLLRLGWLGYIAIPLAWPDVSARLPAAWAPAVQVTACCLISGLYATQTFMLHFGERRTP
jgi:hypothetical protein